MLRPIHHEGHEEHEGKKNIIRTLCVTIFSNLRGLRKISVGCSYPPSHRTGDHGGLHQQIRFHFAFFAVNFPNSNLLLCDPCAPFVVKSFLPTFVSFVPSW